MTHRIDLRLPLILPPLLSDDQRLRSLAEQLSLTPCQAKVVLAGIGDLTYREIGENLGMAEGTVKAHYSRVFEKSGCSTRNGATALAVGLLWQAAQSG